MGPDAGDDWALLALLNQLMDEPFYGELRTKQQLGYIVSCGVAESNGVRGVVFSVQSKVLPPPEVQARVTDFLKQFRADLAKMPEGEIDANKESLANRVVDVDNRLAQQASRLPYAPSRRIVPALYPADDRRETRVCAYSWRQANRFWSEIAVRRYDYGRPWRVQKVIRKLNRSALLAFFDATFGDGNQRALATHVFAAADAPKSLREDALPDGFYPPPADRLEI